MRGSRRALGRRCHQLTVEFDSSALTVQNGAEARGSSASTTPGRVPVQLRYARLTSRRRAAHSRPTASPSARTAGYQPVIPTRFCPDAVGDADRPGRCTGKLLGRCLQHGPNSALQYHANRQPSATVTLTKSSLAAGECTTYSGNYKPSGVVTAGDLGGAAADTRSWTKIKVTGATAGLGSNPGHDATCITTFAATPKPAQALPATYVRLARLAQASRRDVVRLNKRRRPQQGRRPFWVVGHSDL